MFDLRCFFVFDEVGICFVERVFLAQLGVAIVVVVRSVFFVCDGEQLFRVGELFLGVDAAPRDVVLVVARVEPQLASDLWVFG